VGRAAMDVDPYEMAFHWVPGAPSHRPEHVTVMGLGRMIFVRRSGSRVFFTGGNRAVYRGYRWGTVTVPSGSNRSQNSNLNLN
jgi:hypothetical protein